MIITKTIDIDTDDYPEIDNYINQEIDDRIKSDDLISKYEVIEILEKYQSYYKHRENNVLMADALDKIIDIVNNI